MNFMLNLESHSAIKEDFYDWARHLKSFMTKYQDSLELLLHAEGSSTTCTHEDILVIAKTKGEAGTVVYQGQGCGCEA